MALIKICKLDLVPPGELKHFNIGELEVLVVNLQGQFHCLAARCTHAGAPLVEGELKDGVLICPWHYSHFRVTDGTVVEGPAERPLKVFKNEIKDDYLFLEL